MIGEEFGEAAIEHMGELAEIARAEEEHWERVHPEIRDLGGGAAETRQAASLPGLVVTPLLALPLAAQRRLVRAWLEMNAPDLTISFRLIEEALELARGSLNRGAAGRKLELPDGWNLQRGRQELLLDLETFAGRGETAHYQYALPVPGAVEVPELRAYIEARVVDVGGVPEDERGGLLDLARMPKEVLIRNWRAGDRFWPAHTAAAKKVKELLSDRHATGAEKKLWPVAVAAGCGLIWMRGFAVPAAFQAPAGASKAIWIREIAGMM
jgi:tRNA(Ile)-lysidine synthetase-like protein